ncbi:hypothetical protein QLX08_008347 [Tetragonisca angustula]|uniref:Uncharacterized protein n=1 Tax=Tetragonisca angustula TaxID=166442 RepID=A0AAW0ZNL1_9HYME
MPRQKIEETTIPNNVPNTKRPCSISTEKSTKCLCKSNSNRSDHDTAKRTYRQTKRRKTSGNLPTINEMLQPTITLIDNTQDRFPPLKIVTTHRLPAGSNDPITLAYELRIYAGYSKSNLNVSEQTL